MSLKKKERKKKTMEKLPFSTRRALHIIVLSSGFLDCRLVALARSCLQVSSRISSDSRHQLG